MSRIGKEPIVIPKDVEAKVEDGVFTVKGPHGELSREFRSEISVAVEDNTVVVKPVKETQTARVLWGTYASHIRNMLSGVSEKYEKQLIIEGVGFRAAVEGNKLVMQVGFSHPVELEIPQGLSVVVEKETISISGIDKELLGSFTATIRSMKKPEPYKGKGIRYKDEIIRRKQGKKAIGAGE